MLLEGCQGDKFSTETKVTLRASDDDLVFKAKKTFEDPTNFEIIDGKTTTKTSDSITWHAKGSVKGVNTHLELDKDSQFSWGVQKKFKTDDAEYDASAWTSGSSLALHGRAKLEKLNAYATVDHIDNINAYWPKVEVGATASNLHDKIKDLKFAFAAEVDNAELTAYSVGGQYTGEDFSLAAAVESPQVIRANFHKPLDNTTAFAGSMHYDFKEKTSDSTIGFMKRLPKEMGSISVRLAQSGKLGAAYLCRLRKGLCVKATAESDLSENGFNVKGGMQVHLGADL